MSSARHMAAPSRRRRIIWIVTIVVVAILLVTLWTVIRGLLARDALLGAVPLIGEAKIAVVSGNTTTAESDFAEVKSRADQAATLTSDPIWRSVEIVPGIGPNLRAFREAAGTIDDVANQALPPIGKLASSFTLASFAPKDGAFDLAPFAAAAPQLTKIQKVLDAAHTKADDIDTSGTLPQISAAIRQLKGVVSDASSTVDGLATAARLLPAMLGADGPRDYLLLSLNNAELRTTGGIPGALAVLHTDGGKITLARTASDALIGEFADPVLPLSDAEKTLYQNLPGQFIQDVTMTPDFARSGALAQEMWKRRTGQTVDGVLAIDPVALSYVLDAIGPVQGPSGVQLTSSNAVDVLLNRVYSDIPKPADQDAFFASVTHSIFQKALGGGTSDTKLVDAVLKSASEQRMHLWSAHADEQTLLAGTTLATAEPQKQNGKTALGVYLNDGTGAKMDYYLRAGVGTAAIMCRADNKPYFEARIALTSTAPSDAATSLPEYVTGGGFYGVDPGTIRTNVFVHAPKGTVFYGVKVNGREVSWVAATGSDSVAGVTVLTAPGTTVTIAFEMLGTTSAPTATTLQTTPMSSPAQNSVDNSMSCPVLPDAGHTANALGSDIVTQR